MSFTIPPNPAAVNDTPVIKPYQEAVDFQRKRTALLREDYYSRAMDAARPRAFTVTGLTKYSSLMEANRLGETAIASNMTMSDYADRLGEIVDEHGGTLLSPERLELIHHNAMTNNNAAGAWQQMTDPDFVQDRPYFLYDGPSDGKISRICKPLHGLIVHYKDPILKHWWHPNHHWERHEWVSLAKDDVDPKKVYVSPDGQEYPVVNGQVLRPADGWDYNAAEVFAADDSSFTRAAAELNLGAGHTKTPDSYGLGSLMEGTHPAAPVLPGQVSKLASARERFEAIFGFNGARRTIVLDYAKDGVWVTGDSFEALAASAGEDELAELFALEAAALQEPAEVWFVPATLPSGESAFVKRYLGVFTSGDDQVAVWVDRSPEGWAMAGGRVGSDEELERLRRGLLTHSRAGRKP
jgi:hypothetical protein